MIDINAATLVICAMLIFLCGVGVTAFYCELRLVELSRHAADMHDLCKQGNFSNGVTDPSGSMDEGEYMAASIIDAHRMAWLKTGRDITGGDNE